MKADQVVQLARELVSNPTGFSAVLGPGAGNKATNAFMRALRAKAEAALGEDFSEKAICGKNRLCVDFYFPDEGTILEVALGLPNPNTEFEKDIIKAIMAVERGNRVQRLVFISRVGAVAKCAQPGRVAMIEWARANHGIAVEVTELPGVRRTRKRR